MAKRLSDKQKKEIIELFKNGITVDNLSDKYNFTKLTISRNLKKYFGEEKYKEIYKKNSKNIDASLHSKDYEGTQNDIESGNYEPLNSNNCNLEDTSKLSSPFIEITPLNTEFEKETQKDLSSIPISDINFPKVVYMIVDKRIELQTKYLKEYSEWQFLSKNELDRKTIEIHSDLKIAKRSCSKEQKVIKVPNPDIFRLIAPILRNRGISRIVSCDQLIAL